MKAIILNTFNILDVFEEARIKLDKLELPDDIGGSISTPYGMIKWYGKSVEGSKRAINWLKRQILI